MQSLKYNGWISEIFDINCELKNGHVVKASETSEKYSIPWHAYRSNVNIFQHDHILEGNLTLIPPENTSTWIWGVYVTLQEYVTYADPFIHSDVVLKKIKIYDEGYIDKKTEIIFEINLNNIKRNIKNEENSEEIVQLTGDFNGNLFGIQHLLIFQIHRPWYTFDIYHYEPFMIQNITNILPPETTRDSNNSLPHIIDLYDEDKLICQFNFNNDHIPTNGWLEGKIKFSSNLSIPIISGKISINKLEYALNHHEDDLLIEHLFVELPDDINNISPSTIELANLNLNNNRDKIKNNNIDEEKYNNNEDREEKKSFDARILKGPLKGGEEIKIALPLRQLCLYPSFQLKFRDLDDPINGEIEDIGVYYFIKLTIIFQDKTILTQVKPIQLHQTTGYDNNNKIKKEDV